MRCALVRTRSTFFPSVEPFFDFSARAGRRQRAALSFSFSAAEFSLRSSAFIPVSIAGHIQWCNCMDREQGATLNRKRQLLLTPHLWAGGQRAAGG